jgi:hypothetical protein
MLGDHPIYVVLLATEFCRAKSPVICQLVARPLPLHRRAPMVRIDGGAG